VDKKIKRDHLWFDVSYLDPEEEDLDNSRFPANTQLMSESSFSSSSEDEMRSITSGLSMTTKKCRGHEKERLSSFYASFALVCLELN
jgi:hypothetical protein